jgi:hypothetical protein
VRSSQSKTGLQTGLVIWDAVLDHKFIVSSLGLVKNLRCLLSAPGNQALQKDKRAYRFKSQSKNGKNLTVLSSTKEHGLLDYSVYLVACCHLILKLK